MEPAPRERSESQNDLLRSKQRWQRVFFLCFANFALFFLLGLLLGGDAVNGYRDGDRYFLVDHGRVTEVGRLVYSYSMVHVATLVVSHPLGLIAALNLYRLRRKLKWRTWGLRGL